MIESGIFITNSFKIISLECGTPEKFWIDRGSVFVVKHLYPCSKNIRRNYTQHIIIIKTQQLIWHLWIH